MEIIDFISTNNDKSKYILKYIVPFYYRSGSELKLIDKIYVNMPIKKHAFKNNELTFFSYKPLTKLIRKISIKYGIKMNTISYMTDDIFLDNNSLESEYFVINTINYFYTIDSTNLAKIRKTKLKNLMKDL